MANIVGEPFDQYVLDQIANRQKIHGSQERTPSEISYLNARTGYIKITSGVKVMDPERIKRIDLGNHASFINAGPDQGLANFFVLFNGTSDNNNTLFGGIDGFNDGYTNKPLLDKGQTILNKSAYGSGDHDFGTRPMAGIISAETKFRNRGSIREGTIQIKAWNRTQFEIINLLYLRLGFPMLLEWGHTIYVDEIGGINSSPNFSFSKSFLRGDFKTDNQILETLEIQRKKSAGNYDAMYGKVVNFDWTFNKDGSYNITLKLISVGAVVEALKMNVYQKDVVAKIETEKEDTDNIPDNDEDWIEKFQFSHTIGSIFWKAMKLLFRGNRLLETDKIDFINGSELSGYVENVKYINSNTTDKDYILYGLDGVDEFFLVRFGELARLLKNLIPHNNIDSDNPFPIVDIIDLDDIPDLNNLTPDHPQAKNVVFMYTTPQQISGNPGKCLIGGFAHPINTGETYLEPLVSNPYKTTIKNYQVGLLKDVYINMAFILQILQDNVDKDGNVSFIDLLNAILTSVNECLGSVNHIECVVDENTNTIKFVDSTPIPGYDEITGVQEQYDKAVPFNIYGYYNNFTSAGFVRDFSLKTEITNNLAAMMTIGATANGSVVGEDATAFSKWNKGLLPIIGENLISGFADPKKATPKPTVDSAQKEIDALIKENKQLLEDYKVFVYESNTYDLDEEEIASGNQLIANVLEYYKNLGLLEEKKKQLTTNPDKTPALVSATSSRGFLPINLSLTMDGLSGVKIYQQIKVDTSYLPSDYPGALKFIIKGVSHKIDRGGWITTVETVSVPVIDSLQLPSTSGTTPTTQQTISQQQSPDVKNASRNTAVGQNPPPLTHTNDPNISQIRNAVVKIAKGYVGQSEIPENIVNGKNVNDNLGFNDKSFEAKMKGVGWYSSNNALWCNWFADLVWKEAYTQVGANDSKIQNIFKTKLNLKVLPPLSAGVFNTLNAAVKGGFGKISPQLSDIKPGDMIVYNYGHVNICVAVNQQDGTISTVGGNEGGGSKSRNGGRVVYTAKRNFKTADIKGIVKIIE
jgi:hypothetical protein